MDRSSQTRWGQILLTIKRTTIIFRIPIASFARARAAAVSCKCWWKAHITSIACSRLIGTPTSRAGGTQIEQILTQLRARQIAEEQVETYTRQQKAAAKECELREAESRALQQTRLTESELSIIVQTNQGKADLARAQQQATQIQALAQAEAEKVRILGEGEAKKIEALARAEAERTARVGVAQALAIEEQVRAYGGPKFQLTQQVMARFTQAIETAQVDVVPKILIASGKNQGNGHSGQPGTGNVMEAMLAMLLNDKLEAELTPNRAPRPAAAESIRSQLLNTARG